MLITSVLAPKRRRTVNIRSSAPRRVAKACAHCMARTRRSRAASPVTSASSKLQEPGPCGRDGEAGTRWLHRSERRHGRIPTAAMASGNESPEYGASNPSSGCSCRSLQARRASPRIDESRGKDVSEPGVARQVGRHVLTTDDHSAAAAHVGCDLGTLRGCEGLSDLLALQPDDGAIALERRPGGRALSPYRRRRRVRYPIAPGSRATVSGTRPPPSSSTR